MQYFLPLVLLFLCALLPTVRVVGRLCVVLLSNVYLCYLMCIVLLSLLLSYILQLPDCWLEVSIRKVLRPTTWAQVFLGFPVSKSECRDCSPRLQVATACFSCSPPDLNFLDPYFIFMYMHYNHCHRTTAHLQLNICTYIYIYIQSTPYSDTVIVNKLQNICHHLLSSKLNFNSLYINIYIYICIYIFIYLFIYLFIYYCISILPEDVYNKYPKQVVGVSYMFIVAICYAICW